MSRPGGYGDKSKLPLAIADPQQDRFEGLRAQALRRVGGRLVDLSYANPTVEVDPQLRAALIETAAGLSAAELQYSPFAGTTKVRRLIATRLERDIGLPFIYRDVVLTSGATGALSITISSAFAPGDEVVLLRPTWFDYPLYLRDRGLEFRFVPLTEDKRIDLDELSGAIDGSTAGLILSQPQVPTGVILSEVELRGVAEILEQASKQRGRAILLVSDEAHRDTAWADCEVRSPLEFYAHAVTAYSFGKSWHAQGMRLGYAAVSPASPARQELAAALPRTSRAMGFGCPNTMMQALAARLVRLVPDSAWLRDAQLFMRLSLEAQEYEVVDAGATMFVYAKSPIEDEWRFIERLARSGVLALPSTLCHEPGHFRLALNVSRDELEPVATIFAQARSAL